MESNYVRLIGPEDDEKTCTCVKSRRTRRPWRPMTCRKLSFDTEPKASIIDPNEDFRNRMRRRGPSLA